MFFYLLFNPIKAFVSAELDEDAKKIKQLKLRLEQNIAIKKLFLLLFKIYITKRLFNKPFRFSNTEQSMQILHFDNSRTKDVEMVSKLI